VAKWKCLAANIEFIAAIMGATGSGTSEK